MNDTTGAERTGESRTRACKACGVPSALGYRTCQECGCPDWVWRGGKPPAGLVIARSSERVS